MAKSREKKQRLINQLAEGRVRIADETLILRDRANLAQRFSATCRNHPWTVMAAASACGLILSRLPTRKKTVYVYRSNEVVAKMDQATSARKQKSSPPLWRYLWSFLKWLLTGYITRQLLRDR